MDPTIQFRPSEFAEPVGLIGTLGGLSMVFYVVAIIAVVILRIAFSSGVYYIADQREKPGGPGNVFVGSVIWALATLAGGVMVALAYWVIHMSTLAANESNSSDE